jgi:hypothetical protein
MRWEKKEVEVKADGQQVNNARCADPFTAWLFHRVGDYYQTDWRSPCRRRCYRATHVTEGCRNRSVRFHLSG